MIRLRSLQARLSLLVAGGITVIWLIGGIFAAIEVHEELEDVFDSSLRETAQRILPLAALDLEEHEDDEPRRVPVLGAHEEYLTYVVRDGQGQIVLKSHNADSDVFDGASRAGFASSLFYRFYSETTLDRRWRIDVAEPLERRREATLEALSALLGPLLFLIPVSIAAVWLLVRISLRPVTAISSQIEIRGGDNLKPVTVTSPPYELEPMIEAVNQLLKRLARTLSAERSFTANSAHELRTPIAASLAHVQRLIAEAPAGPLQERAVMIERAMKDLARLSEKLMQLAKAEGGGVMGNTAQDLYPVLQHTLHDLEADAHAQQIEIMVADDAVLTSHMDADAFAILIRNLIENAIKHGPTGSTVDISFPAHRQIRIVNDCARIEAAFLNTLRDRFRRGATTAQGSGIGLAIADAIMSGTGGHLELRSPATGRTDGFEVVVDLPA